MPSAVAPQGGKDVQPVFCVVALQGQHPGRGRAVRSVEARVVDVIMVPARMRTLPDSGYNPARACVSSQDTSRLAASASAKRPVSIRPDNVAARRCCLG